MRRQIAISGSTIELDVDPNECPYCLKVIVPEFVIAKYFNVNGPGRHPIQAMFTCTNTKCGNSFLAVYTFNPSINDVGYNFRWLAKLPIRPSRVFPEAITDLSPQFVNIYNQAHAAEQNELDQISGLGYRKALEFLLKDYLVKKQPEEGDAIKKAMLGNCIKDRIADVRIQEMAKRATWLGNDEAHYVRKWVNKDVQDMKVLIQLVVSLVEQEHLYESYMAGMPDTPKT